MRDYRHEYDSYQGKPEQIKNRAKRNTARALLVKEGRVKKGDGKDAGHKVALANGGGNRRSNIRVENKSMNRSRKNA